MDDTSHILETLLNNVTTGIIIISPDQKVVFGNEEIMSLCSFSDIDKLIHIVKENKVPDNYEFLDKHGNQIVKTDIFQRIIEGNQHPAAEIFGIRKKGSDFITYIRVKSILVRDSKNPLPNIVITLQNITSNIDTENALAKEKEHFSLALQASESAVWTVYINSGIVSFSEHIRQILGNKKFTLDCPFEDILASVHHNDRKKVMQALADIISGDATEYSVEYRMKRVNGSICHVLSQGIVTARDKNKKPTEVSGVTVDISKQKAFESEIEKINRSLNRRVKSELKKLQTQQLMMIQRSKLESLGELAAGIVHEINQPLGIISLLVDLIKEQMYSDVFNKEDSAKRLDEIFENIAKINIIIDQIRIFASNQKLQVKEEFNINAVLTNITKLLQPHYKNNQIEIKLVLSDSLKPVMGSVQQFEQVIHNLLSNAKYALNEKSVSGLYQDFKKEILINTFEETGKVVLNFTDNGPGIPPKLIKKLFDPFYTSKPAGEGTGLGLPICYRIITEMNGEIHFESQPGEFTKVRISLPVFEKTQ